MSFKRGLLHCIQDESHLNNNTMGYTTNNDNIYPIGAIISARENPQLKLVIRSITNVSTIVGK